MPSFALLFFSVKTTTVGKRYSVQLTSAGSNYVEVIAVLFVNAVAEQLFTAESPSGLQVEQMASLQAKWKETKAEAEKKYGTSAHLDLPDIIISHEFSYDAPPGMATADRAMPLPRPMVRTDEFRNVFVLGTCY